MYQLLSAFQLFGVASFVQGYLIYKTTINVRNSHIYVVHRVFQSTVLGSRTEWGNEDPGRRHHFDTGMAGFLEEWRRHFDTDMAQYLKT